MTTLDLINYNVDIAEGFGEIAFIFEKSGYEFVVHLNKYIGTYEKSIW